MRLGPHSRASAFARISPRSAEGKVYFDTVAEMTAYCGGKPTVIERVLIDRAAALELHLALFDRQAVERSALSARNGRQYVAWSNALRLLLREFHAIAGKPKPTTGARSLAEHLAERARTAA